MYKKLLSPVTTGSIALTNRVVMAPLTRSRAGQGDVPRALNVEYYQQRASAGLIVTEASQISRQGQGYAWTPGIYTDEQEAGWKQVVAAVHAKGGRIALQLWHVGRISHSLLQENGGAPVAPSALLAENSQSFVVLPDGTPANVPTEMPRALELTEMPGIVAQYRQAAQRAKRAGFDLVEVHAANGYLLQQFMSTNSNHRTDIYGGSLENRARLSLEAVDAAIAEMGADRVGVRISPHFVAHGILDTEADAMALYLAKEFSARGIAYLHVAEPDWAGGPLLSDAFRNQLRSVFKGTLIYCGNYSAAEAETLIEQGFGDAVAFGRPFIANPDLVTRFSQGAELNMPDRATFYGGDAKGYTDYPTL
ncbi:alkene reductase [Solimicrobium silvestre]|uniref:NADH:flavin oxidoreductases Old Yellow Enzyme family n=1 Tax=Solimicrobium silvestre TaxID=2099400 RepID=A0A2S9GTZ6_9BURK|nr:alkene reductase [Solimicrobium silvestre]PRC91207.1 NADH:flavin oxidoreductases Old Yellow Enzyme family [Solimicrobium silvestre]